MISYLQLYARHREHTSVHFLKNGLDKSCSILYVFSNIELD